VLQSRVGWYNRDAWELLHSNQLDLAAIATKEPLNKIKGLSRFEDPRSALYFATGIIPTRAVVHRSWRPLLNTLETNMRRPEAEEASVLHHASA